MSTYPLFPDALDPLAVFTIRFRSRSKVGSITLDPTRASAGVVLMFALTSGFAPPYDELGWYEAVQYSMPHVPVLWFGCLLKWR